MMSRESGKWVVADDHGDECTVTLYDFTNEYIYLSCPQSLELTIAQTIDLIGKLAQAVALAKR